MFSYPDMTRVVASFASVMPGAAIAACHAGPTCMCVRVFVCVCVRVCVCVCVCV